MENAGLRFVKSSGSHYETGLEMGRLCAAPIQAACRELRKSPGDEGLLASVAARTEALWPDYVAEIRGRAEGAGVPFSDYMATLCYEITGGGGGCSSVVAPREGGATLYHNEDDAYDLTNFIFVREEHGGEYLCHAFAPDSLAGSTFGWTRYLAFSMNFIDLAEPNREGLPTWFALRRLVDAKSIDEVRELMLSIRGLAGAFNLNLIELSSNRAFSVERRLDASLVTELTSPACHTNHLLYLAGEPAEEGSNDLLRRETLRAMLEGAGPVPAEADVLAALFMRGENDAGSVLKRGGPGVGRTAGTFRFDTGSTFAKLWCHLDGHLYEIDRETGAETDKGVF